MEVEVVFLPPIATELHRKLTVVIDVLRATSTLGMMFEAGVRKVTLAGSIDGALDLAGSMSPRPLVCGESGGLAPAGFDMGNSPREYLPGSLAGREIVFFTSNGTRAMRQVGESPVVITGSLLNGTAAVRAALRLARENGLDISFVCSGDYHGSRFGIDDAFCAGYLCSLVQMETVEIGGALPILDETAVAAMRLYRSYLGSGGREPGDARSEATLEAFWESHNAQVLRKVGLSEDVEFCAQLDITRIVPRLSREGDRLVLHPSA